MSIQAKRIYEPYEAADGYRILVDRLWPRGMTEKQARVDLWMGRIAPSSTLRKWYGHEVEKWPEFRERYMDELASREDLLDLIHDIERHNKIVTLLYAAKDEEHNEAKVILEVLQKRPSRSFSTRP